MFSLKSKLDYNLKSALASNNYKHYRVIIHCKNLRENIEKKINSFKAELIRSIPSLNCISASLSASALERLLELPEVSYITFDTNAFLCGSSVLSANGIAFQERYKLTGKGIGIGLIDSGTYPHVDLSAPNNKIKKFIDILNGIKYPYDDNGHGTFMSGIICSNGSASKGMYRGIAENSHLFSVKAFNSIGRGFISDILYAIELILNESKEYNIKVICLPFEVVDYNPFILSLFSKLFDIAVQKGIVVVVPSGNSGNKESSIKGIATLSNCITVAGLDTRKGIKPYIYSSCGPYGKLEKPDIAAACVDICSLNTNKDYVSERNGSRVYAYPLDNPYTTYTGTSCAAAFISGVCALLFENKPDLPFKDIIALLKVSCKLLDMFKWSQGAGMLEINKLLP
ncbi:S8 family serine peptidase [Clostridium sp. SYSU_GA19001]|uniref:S8 family serine peptidase n=1 Tax=Clostridium caldaquaticum TaxID=2940653 RepID=UPI002076E982|nr:S8 family serine peptidase [Clostridium caldaquaticum]MCM8711570.1 S8 family serine peptidase [Clostridium caldaquaticum]